MARPPLDIPAPERYSEPVATFGTSADDVISCRVCGRTLLMGERSTGFFTREGEGPFDVCQLCVSKARKFGLLTRPSTPDEVAGTRGKRGRRKTAGKRRWGWLPPVRAMVQRDAAVTIPTGAPPVGTAAIPQALAAFNASEHARTLAGLHKTLGAPEQV